MDPRALVSLAVGFTGFVLGVLAALEGALLGIFSGQFLQCQKPTPARDQSIAPCPQINHRSLAAVAERCGLQPLDRSDHIGP